MTPHRSGLAPLAGGLSLACAIAAGLLHACSEEGKEGTRGVDASTFSIAPEELARLAKEIPPPPADSVKVQPTSPLRNGPWVVRKERRVWVPPGERITVQGGTLVVPDGTRVWKDFFYGDATAPGGGTGSVGTLIERRLLVKVPPSPSAKEGWLFLSSYVTPGVELAGKVGTVLLQSPRIESFALNPAAALPVNPYPSDVRISLGGKARYVFPGTRQCAVCHAGAQSFLAGPPESTAAASAGDRAPFLSFTLNPAGLTRASVEALKAKGWIDDAAIAAFPPLAFPKDQPLRSRMQSVMRNNCLSCHNGSPRAAGRYGAFRLDPTRVYGKDELLAALQGRTFSGSALHDVSEPVDSEIVRRAQGRARGQMPPQDGGVPEVDTEVADLLSSWAHYDAGKTWATPKGAIECPDGWERIAVGRAGGTACTDGASLLGPFTKGMREECIKRGGGDRACNSETWELKFGLSIRGDARCPKGASLDAATGYCAEGVDVFGPFPAYVQQRCLDVVKGGDACLKSRWSLAALKGSL